jgi:hypothetical protein
MVAIVLGRGMCYFVLHSRLEDESLFNTSVKQELGRAVALITGIERCVISMGNQQHKHVCVWGGGRGWGGGDKGNASGATTEWEASKAH